MELIKGKWYKFKTSLKDTNYWYVKYGYKSDSMYKCEEWMNDSQIYTKGDGNFSYEYATPYEEINISEIANLLPMGHPDLLPQKIQYEYF